MIELNIEYMKGVNFALTNNAIETCQSVTLKNLGDDLHDVCVECSGEYFATTNSVVIPLLAHDKELRLANFSIKPDNQKMVMLTESINTTFCIKIWADCGNLENRKEVFSNEFDIRLLAYDQWLGTDILPQSLTAFIMPNHPAISKVVVEAGAILKQMTGESAFNAYQTHDPKMVLIQVAAVYAAIHQQGIVYRALPASFECIGQRVTLPYQVLEGKLGNCIELTILFASVLEAIGLNTGIIIQQGHAFLAVWLVDDCYQHGICDDASFVDKKCSKGINEMIVLETTMATHENTAFDKALQEASLKLADASVFQMMIDVKRCRLENYRPMPCRVMTDNGWVLEQGVEHDSCSIDVRECSRYDLSNIRVIGARELSRMDIWERKLLDFSLRNNMLNLYLRQKAIQLISFEVDKLEDQLQEGREFRIMEKPDIDLKIDDSDRLVHSRLYPSLQPLVVDDLAHDMLHTYHTEAETKNTLKNIYRAARNAIEETGANSLFLAIGTLRWYENEVSQTPRYAPILMLPVEMVYKKGGYFIRTRDEDIMLNVTLTELLRQNYGIAVPVLSNLPKDNRGVDVQLIFTMLRDALKEQKRWDVEEECILGVFSFSKFLMWNDIHNHREELLGNKVIESLVAQRLTWQPEPLTSTLKEKDKQMRPDELALPVAVDSSQMAAVFEAGLGHSFILYGPPGTGKSQTITNLIANALFQGKRVLFVAEKMAALSVVQRRLAKIGLDPFCLEMHSNKVTKRHILDQFAKALGVTHIMSPEEYAHTAEKLYAERTKLIEYMEALHENKGEDGFSLYDCILRYESKDCDTWDEFLKVKGQRSKDESLSPSTFDLSPSTLNKSTLPDYEHLLGGRFESVIKLVGQPSHHALVGLGIEETDLANENTLRSSLQDAMETLSPLSLHRERAGGLQSPPMQGDLEGLYSTRDLHDELLRDNSENIFAQDAEALHREWMEIRAKWFVPRFFAKRSYLNRMRQFSPYIIEADVDKVLDKLSTYTKQHKQICEVQKVGEKYFGKTYELDALPSKSEIENMIAKLGQWSENLGGSRDWYQWCQFRKEAIEKGLSALVDIIEHREVDASKVLDMTMKTIFMQLAKKKIGESAVLRTFEGMIFDETVSLYKKLTADFQMLSQKELYAKLAARVPRVTDNIDSSSEIGLLNRNISNGGRGLSLRDLMDQIPTLMPRLCPCMLMSPMSVAQYLSLNQEKFDLVIFDEASQMPTSEAIGAIARGNALIVVGDPKQMPPTSFFTSTNVDEEEAEIDDLESILEDCRTLEIPSLQLNWHYRSQHESLIAFSNNEYYDGSLITFPSVDDQQTKVKLVPVDGVYDKGGKRSNKAEAEAIVDEIERRLKGTGSLPTGEGAERGSSIGVIAFSVVQQNLIEDILQERLENDKVLREAADELYEPIFVKNLENVQGDERDVILFSIGYGPDKTGKVSMNFGPLNNKGGERRLNVAVSRARQEMMVFSTLRSSQIDLRRTNARGVEGLKHFLEYAEQQILIQTESSIHCGNDSLIAKQIAKALNEKGYQASINIGRSQFKVDVAVSRKDQPDVYQLGILLDGEGYHSTQTTRDREIVQTSVLGNLRWQVMRVWSVDWFNNPERVIGRIIEKISSEENVGESASSLRGSAGGEASSPTFDISNEKVEEVQSNALEYKEFGMAQSKVNTASDHKLATAILEVEQPMSFMQLCRRIAAWRGIPRVTPTLQTDIMQIAKQDMYVVPDRKGFTVWLNEEASHDYTTYRPASGRDVTDIPMAEIRNVVLEAVAEQFSINADSLSLIAAKKLGFTRRGINVDEALTIATQQLCDEGKIEITDGNIHLKGE